MKDSKRMLGFIMAVMMILAMIPAVFADDVVTNEPTIIKINEDTVIDEDIEITEETQFVMADGVTLDLNGKTVSAKDGKALFSGENFTIKNGTFKAIGNKDYYLLTIDSGSDIVLEGLTVTGGGVKIRGGATVTLQENEIIANQNQFKYAVWAYGKANVTIVNGTYFGGKNGYDVFAEDKATINVLGGTYKYTIVERNMNDELELDEAGEYYVVEALYVAQVGEKKYESLTDAIEAANADDTIILLEDTYALPDGVTLDLEGHTLTTTGVTFTGENITIENGTIALPAGNTSYYVLYIGNQDGDRTTATLKDIETTAGIQVINADATLEEVTAKGGNNKSRYAVAAFAGSNVTINSGNYTSCASAKRDVSMEKYSTLVVYGGTFSKNVPDEYLAEDYISVKNNDKTYSVRKGNYVAEVNSVRYEDLQAAINAAPTYYDVKLLSDIEVNEQIIINTNINLVLGEYTITGNSEEAIVRIYSDEVDTTIGVTIDATTGGIVNNGTGYAIYAGEDLADGSDKERTNLTINGGKYETEGTDCIKQIMGQCTINGGSYKSSYCRTVLNGERWYGAEFKINGGMFYEFNPACVSVWTGFDGKDFTNFYHQHDIIDDGKTVEYDDGWYTVVDGEYTPVAEVKSLCYPSIEAALKASIELDDVANLGVITLLADDTIDLGKETIELPKGLVIDLNGNTLTVPFQKTLFAGENITIKNGTITTGSTENYGLYIMGGSFTVENVVCTNGINVQAGEVTLIDVDATCPNKYYAVYAGADANVTILSGNYSVVRNAKVLYAAGTITVYGGTFNKSPNAFVAEGEDLHVVKSGNWYTVYEGFQAALEAAEEGDTVYLMSDIEVAETINIDKELTLDLGASTITSTAAKNVIYSTANLTIEATEGGIYSETARTAILQDDGVCTINGGSFKASGETGDHANGQPICNTLVLNNSDFESGVTGSFEINDGKFYMFNPACMSVNKHDHHNHDQIADGMIATLDEEGWFTVAEGEFAYEVICECSAPASAHQHCFVTEGEAELFIEMMGGCKFDKVVAIAE